ncbi:MAG: type II toxin-antitoxin system RelE/ParE family toxin [Akkermansiaceae bacterium]|nr:type II toxin-antitoxin system RelE/ParE family toxin [Akkermansiaceae bacterium]
MLLHFIESPVFSEQIDGLLSEEEQRQLQLTLLEQPERGDLIKGSGGLRKLRFAGSGRGKRGGIRVVYYLWHEDTAFMLLAYPKNKQSDLTPPQLKLLKTLIQGYTNE